MRVAATVNPDTHAAVEELAEALATDRGDLVFVFASIAHDPRQVAELAQAAFPDADTVGCTTCGELGPDGRTRGGISALSLRAEARAVEWIEDLGAFRFDRAAAVVGRSAQAIGRTPAELVAGDVLFVTLLGAPAAVAERFASAVGFAAPGVPTVGGSAGDDDRYAETWTFANGRAAPGSGVIVLLEPGVPFFTFAAHHYEPTSQRVVVTDCDPGTNRVFALNGKPAAQEYARLAGLEYAEPEASTPLEGLPVQFGLDLPNGFFIRSAIAADHDALLMASPVMRGEVLGVGRAGALVETTKNRMAEVAAAVGKVDANLVFDCRGRSLEAERLGQDDALAQAICGDGRTAGFCSYGEQIGPILVNHTLTGVVFGERR